MDAKTVKIDYLYLDNETCTRCRETEKQLEVTLDKIDELLKTAGFHCTLSKVKMDSREKAVEYRFSKSPTIKVNGVDIGFEQTENECLECGDLGNSGGDTTCRTWVFDGQEYEVPPKELLIDRIMRVVYGHVEPEEQDFKLPENLEDFYAGMEKGKKEECCTSACCS